MWEWTETRTFDTMDAGFFGQEVELVIDFQHLEKYRENNRIEAKKSLGGLPHSIWETYSAFANTLGGMLLLGVVELPDKSLQTVNLPDPQALIEEFWQIVNDPRKISANILTRESVCVQEIQGNRIVSIVIPRAQRCDRPVYMDGNPYAGSYRRNGEGDYKCTREEVDAMLRDAALQSQDMAVLEHFGMNALDFASIRRYCMRLRPFWQGENMTFLAQLGAIGAGADGQNHPTAAGLLLFGREREIVRQFPGYRLVYREQKDVGEETIDSASDGWSGNLFDFYTRVCARLAHGIQPPCDGKSQGAASVSAYAALREALANCLIHADYCAQQGIEIVKTREEISFSNPGSLRVAAESARRGERSDPRNDVVSRILARVDIGARSGGGVANIYQIWKGLGWNAPKLMESFAPDRVVLTLPLTATDGMPSGVELRGGAAERYRAEIVIAYLTDHASANAAEIAALLNVQLSCAQAVLDSLMQWKIVTKEESMYRLSD